MATSLAKDLRKILEKVTGHARSLAESACRAALENLAVHEREFRSHMTPDQRRLRNRLRARGRALGDIRDERSGTQRIDHLTELCAYEHWHRILFTKFLTENHLLMTDEANGCVPVTLEECEELAPEMKARDGLDLACRFAGLMLPGVFRKDDPVLDLSLAINDQVELGKLLASLPTACFSADDALGWTYQFWQAQRKAEINEAGLKIGADELSPVTQLFTEDYMVEFLLHNTLGAWWAGRRKYELESMNYETEEEARRGVSLASKDGIPGIDWKYLRFVQEPKAEAASCRFFWKPAAGAFDGWPREARLIKLLDPCMGSGHFLVFALPILVRLRMEEEKINYRMAVVGVLKDNLFGLELDERCTQIAAFNVALTAWRITGYQPLPALHLACSGHAPSGTIDEWKALAGGNERARNGMARLHGLFQQAPAVGSLLNPRLLHGNVFDAGYEELAQFLQNALAMDSGEENKGENDSLELAVVAQGLNKATELLTARFTLVITNVPYLGRGKQTEDLREYTERAHPDAKADLATCFVERCLDFCEPGGSTGLVTPQNWLFLTTYKNLRSKLLQEATWNTLGILGENGFASIQAAGAFIAMIVLSRSQPSKVQAFSGLDVSGFETPDEKALALCQEAMEAFPQEAQLHHPDARLVLSAVDRAPLLNHYCKSLVGIQTNDNPRFIQYFWEHANIGGEWQVCLTTTDVEGYSSGRTSIIRFNPTSGPTPDPMVSLRGESIWGRNGVAISRFRNIQPFLYTGEAFEQNVAVVCPEDERYLEAVWAFLASPEFIKAVRLLDRKLNVTNATLGKVPFDADFWHEVAQRNPGKSIPTPEDDDPTQWLFCGHPRKSKQPLHVAVSRLLGYRWPRQTGSSFLGCPALGPDGLESFVDEDGIVCLPPLNREQPAANRLRQLLTASLGSFDERSLIASAGLKGSKSKTLEDWLRDEFFEQHAKLFHNRPFVWHIWDGRDDGFHALVNYHQLDHANLQKLTFSYLGDWIQQQTSDSKADKPGAAERLGAAKALEKKLASILEGEAPLDIFVRWKPLQNQAQGWHPDLNDGIRQNIRPFLFAGDVGKKGAGVFRSVPLKLNCKDRGIEPERSKSEYPWFWCEDEPATDPSGSKKSFGNRWNNAHLTLAGKKVARA